MREAVKYALPCRLSAGASCPAPFFAGATLAAAPAKALSAGAFFAASAAGMPPFAAAYAVFAPAGAGCCAAGASAAATDAAAVRFCSFIKTPRKKNIFKGQKGSPAKKAGQIFEMCAQNARPSKNILFLSGLYRRYGNYTRSEAAAFRRLYCRWGIAPRPKESFCFPLFIVSYYTPRRQNCQRFCREKSVRQKRDLSAQRGRKKRPPLSGVRPALSLPAFAHEMTLICKGGRRIAPPLQSFLFSALCRAARKAADVHPHFL